MAEYTFVSEGQESVMEVVFKLQGNKLIQGYAEMEEQSGKLVFKDGVKLSFQNTFVRTNGAVERRETLDVRRENSLHKSVP
jgi:hypothetical protein